MNCKIQNKASRNTSISATMTKCIVADATAENGNETQQHHRQCRQCRRVRFATTAVAMLLFHSSSSISSAAAFVTSFPTSTSTVSSTSSSPSSSEKTGRLRREDQFIISTATSEPATISAAVSGIGDKTRFPCFDTHMVKTSHCNSSVSSTSRSSSSSSSSSIYHHPNHQKYTRLQLQKTPSPYYSSSSSSSLSTSSSPSPISGVATSTGGSGTTSTTIRHYQNQAFDEVLLPMNQTAPTLDGIHIPPSSFNNINRATTKTRTETKNEPFLHAIQPSKLSLFSSSSSSMVSSVKSALNQRLNEYDEQIIHSSSRQQAIGPKLPPLPKLFQRHHDHHQQLQQQQQHEEEQHRINLVSRIDYAFQSKNKNSNIRKINKYTSTMMMRQGQDQQSKKIQQRKKQMKRKQLTSAIRNLWKKRHARSIEEGIRRERIPEDDNKKKKNGSKRSSRNRRVTSSSSSSSSSSTSNKDELSVLLQGNTFSDILNEGGDDTNNINNKVKEESINDEQDNNNNRKKKTKKQYVARTISGLISALAEEATGLDVNVQMKDDTPLWQKQVDKLSIQFERLGVKQLKMGGLDDVLQQKEEMEEEDYELQHGISSNRYSDVSSTITDAPAAIKELDTVSTTATIQYEDDEGELVNLLKNSNSSTSTVSSSSSADHIFDQIDVDKSGALDAQELTSALIIASGITDPTPKSMAGLGRLAQRLLRLYDTNGDGVVDRVEYKRLVADMTSVRNAQRLKQLKRQERRKQRLVKRQGRLNPLRWGRVARRAIFRMRSGADSVAGAADANVQKQLIKFKTRSTTTNDDDNDQYEAMISSLNELEFGRKGNDDEVFEDEDVSSSSPIVVNGYTTAMDQVEDISNDSKVMNVVTKGEGSIVLEDLKLDLRRLVFGALPVVKKITPGGPLILEPFKMTITGSFNREDMLESVLLDDGLRRLVARALKRRVRSIRDLVDGAVFYGRTWNMASKQAPVVEVPKLTDVEFDNKNRLIITGRAKVRTSPDQPFVENSFKLRTKLGTRENGQYIRLEEPELALMIECPKQFEKNIVILCKTFKLPIPIRPEPIEQYFPLVSPIKKTEADGFNLGDDNRIKSIYVKDNALRFEMSAVLRPGRFLGNHYLAFTIPNRTFIITMDRIREQMRTMRENKRKNDQLERKLEKEEKKASKDRYNKAVAQALSQSNDFGQDAELSYQKELDQQYTFLEPESESLNDVVENEVLPNRPGFVERFLEGYLDAAREESDRERNERLTTAISEFFSSDETAQIHTVVDSNGKVKRRAIV